MRYKKQTLPLIVSNYSGLFGVEVKMQGDRAFTDGKSITIPRLHLDDDYVSALAFAYLAHEASHIRYSDFKCIKKAHRQGSVFFHIFNVLEDARVERLIGRHFIGVYENLRDLRLSLLESESDFALFVKRSSDICVILTYLSILSSVRFQGFDLNAYLNIALSSLKDRGLSHLAYDLDCLVNSGVKSCATEDIYVLSKKVYALFGSYAMDDERQLTDKDREESNAQEICAGSALSDEDSADGKGGAAIVTTRGLDDFKKYIESIEDSSTKNTVPAIMRPLEYLLNEEFDENTSSRDDFGLIGQSISADGDSEFKHKVLKNTVKSRSTLVRRIMGLKEDLRSTALRGRKINVKRVPFIRYGYQRVFLKKEYIADFDTCIQLLVDVSGSMLCQDSCEQSRAQMACECALSIALSLEGFEDLDLGVTYFPGVNSEYETALSFKESASVVASRFDQKPRGSTPLAQALWHAMRLFDMQHRSRNIVIVITDGIPDSISRAQEALDALEKNNVEIYGIGINVNAIEDLIKKSVVIQKSSDLLETSFNLFLKLFDRKYYI